MIASVLMRTALPVLAVSGYSGQGKTTLLEHLVQRLSALGVSVCVFKHSHHALTLDKPGSDSERYRRAGAVASIISGQNGFSLVQETSGEPALDDVIRYAETLSPDLLLLEGFKSHPVPKLWVARKAVDDSDAIKVMNDPNIEAVFSPDLSKQNIPFSPNMAVLDTHEQTFEWVVRWLYSRRSATHNGFDGHQMSLTHLNERGDAHMVDIADKAITKRTAEAESFLSMAPETLELLLDERLPKGDVLASARIAGIQAAKRTSELIPLCHPLSLTQVSIECTPDKDRGGVHVLATCKTDGKTGVEMEALTAASVASLTLYDMCKAVDKRMSIDYTRVRAKQGGKSGDWSLIQNDVEQVSQENEGDATSSQSSALLVRFFGEIGELAGHKEMRLDLDALADTTPAALLMYLERQHGIDLSSVGASRLMVAVNQRMARMDDVLAQNDEVAFFPPVTGG
ncbi:cyclic pyranopterin monophosphate synthase MoaC [Larsenimonas salina]|uniref:cyclic pyranopterin monophosphate synthase MoaC n=1 Tax=Larsenimonas salina TaxID=1295565 RepID=UPI0020741EA2|nr:cyclic pyranopterin monophosphate synthase MoaC [Larsenimonas salina]MCM5703674.1 cyclic pyranopterin monophosphate synthase MoaC [Larsenimonas salina]